LLIAPSMPVVWPEPTGSSVPLNRRQSAAARMSTKPFGVFVIKDGDVTWRPAVDVNRMIVGCQLVAITALFAVRSIVKKRRTRSATEG
jgi:hypothetical protein